MRVAMYYNNHDVRLEEMPVPEIGPGELLFKVQASGLCGSDVMEWYRIRKAPLVLGHEIAGPIAEGGGGVGGWGHANCYGCDNFRGQNCDAPPLGADPRRRGRCGSLSCRCAPRVVSGRAGSSSSPGIVWRIEQRAYPKAPAAMSDPLLMPRPAAPRWRTSGLRASSGSPRRRWRRG